MPTTRPMTRRLKGSRNNVCTTRGEYWLEASWMMSSDTENAMPAKVIVAPAMALEHRSGAVDRRGQPEREICVLIEMSVEGQAGEARGDGGQDAEHRHEEQAGPQPLCPPTQP